MSDSRLLDIQWRRPNDPEILECHGITVEQLVFRIRAVIRMCGSVELISLVNSNSPSPTPHHKQNPTSR